MLSDILPKVASKAHIFNSGVSGNL